MYSAEEIKNMTPEEVKAANEKLAKKLIVRQFIVPIAIATVLHVAVRIIVKKLENGSTED